MAKPTIINWPLLSTTQVASLQNVTSNVVLNTGQFDNSGQVVFPSYQRTLSYTSANNLSAINITANGYDFAGNVVTETRAGPNANTVETTNSFYKITSITTSAPANGLSVGTGTEGILSYVQYNNYPVFFNASLQINVTGTIDYTVYQTLQYFQDSTNQGLVTYTPELFPIVGTLTGATTSQLYKLPLGPITAVQLFVNSSDATGALTFISLQQGVH